MFTCHDKAAIVIIIMRSVEKKRKTLNRTPRENPFAALTASILRYNKTVYLSIF